MLTFRIKTSILSLEIWPLVCCKDLRGRKTSLHISQRLVLSTKDKRNDFLNFNPADTFHLNIRGISIPSLPSRDLSRITQFPIKNRRNQFTKRNIQEYSIIINNKLLTSKGMRIERFPFSLLNTGF